MLRPRLSATHHKVVSIFVIGAHVAVVLFLAGCGNGPETESINRALCASDTENCNAKKCCKTIGKQCYVKDSSWASCRTACTPGVNPKDPPKFQTPWSCDVLLPPVGGNAVATARPPAAPAPNSPAAGPTPTNAEVVAAAETALAASAPSPPQCSAGVTEGGLAIRGLAGDSYLSGAGGTTSETVLTIHHNAGFSVCKECKETWFADNFQQLKLVGQVISFTVDLSKVGCACNLAFYLISNPAVDATGTPSAGDCEDSPYYCDANQVCGQWCPEVDLMEANNHVFQSTVHKCDPPDANGHYSNCDRGGCAGGQNTRNMPNMYGVGAQFTIDTSKPFAVHTFFPESAGTLSGMVTVMRQEGRELTMDHGNCDVGYFAQLSDAMAKGMAARITYWGSDAKTMGWMDQPPCGAQTCDGSNAGDGVISDITITPVGKASGGSGGGGEGSQGPNWFSWFITVVVLAALAGLGVLAWQHRAKLPAIREKCIGEPGQDAAGTPRAGKAETSRADERFSLLSGWDCCGLGKEGQELPPAPVNTIQQHPTMY